MNAYDLCVIGAGPAGFAAATRAHDLGRKVLLVERARVGGAGLHHGALSSKTLWELAKDHATARRTDRGYRATSVELSYPELMASMRAAVAERRAMLEQQLLHLAEPTEHGGRVDTWRGTARLVGPHTIEVTAADGSVRAAGAEFVLVATGSRPRPLPGIAPDGRRVVTSDHLDDLPDFPRRMLVLGAGVIGCEFSTIFASFGKTEVHLLDREPRILPFEDEDVAMVVQAGLKRLGLTIHHGHRFVRHELRDDGVDCVLADASGAETVVQASHLLLSVGRVPCTDGLGLEALGVELLPTGAIRVEDGRSSVPHVFAAGDTTADVALVNVAELEGRHAVEAMFGEACAPVPYDALSSILFVHPEVASVGLNEQQARRKGIAYRAAVVPNTHVARNVAMRATGGFVKLLATPEGRLLGLRVVGPQASSTIQGAAFLIARGGTVADIDACIHAHPAIPEGVQEAARLLLGRSVLKPGAHPGLRVIEGGGVRDEGKRGQDQT